MTETRANSLGAPGYSEIMPCAPESARQARRLVRTALETWQLGQLVDDGELIVTELVSNSAHHSGSRDLAVIVDRTGEQRVRISVSDTSTAPPSPRAPGEEDETGRGLVLIDSLADRWDADYHARGKATWAELEAAT